MAAEHGKWVPAEYGQKQPSEVFYKERCSSKLRKIHRETPVSESPFNEVAGLQRDSGTDVFL